MKKTKQGRRSGPFSDPQMTQIAQIFKHQLPILSICENLCNMWMIPIFGLLSPVSGFQFQVSSFRLPVSPPPPRSPRLRVSPFPVLPRYSASLRLPTLGYTFDLPLNHGAIARVFAPAQLIRRVSRPAPPSELPSAVFDLHRPRCCALRANLRQSLSAPARFPSGFPSRLGRVSPFPLTQLPP